VSEEQIVAAVVGAVAGLIIGYIFGGRMAPGSQQSRELEKKLAEANRSREQFEQRVNMHFADTAGKLNALTQNYREVYEHIASGAAALSSGKSNAAAKFDALQAPETPEEPAAIEADSVVVEPPRDYAPKTSPDDPGTLDENFGLKEGEEAPAEREDAEQAEEEEEKPAEQK
jgi:uncharacterized membrane-anchored protein YhcB (DUF1043 family)